MYAALKVSPEAIPLWFEAQQAGMPLAFPQNLQYPLLAPDDLHLPDFSLPKRLDDVSFRPHRLFFSICRRMWYAMRD